VSLEVEKSNKYQWTACLGFILATSFLYAFLTGSLVSLGWKEYLVDTLVITGCILFFVFFLQKMHVYGMPVYVQIMIFVIAICGLPVLAMYLYLPHERFLLFNEAIPLRVFVGILITIIFFCWRKTRIPAELTEETVQERKSGMAPSGDYADKITVRAGNGIKVIPVEELLFIEADGDYISLVTDNGSWLKEETMKHVQESLSPSRFVRIHRSFIVNVAKINRIERYGQQQLIILNNGKSIRISASGYRTLKETLRF
jgi:hypothetical protein